jgi:putative SOS response-associated peptidase YedK
MIRMTGFGLERLCGGVALGGSVYPSWNVAPTEDAGVIVPEEDGRIFKYMRWGLVPCREVCLVRKPRQRCRRTVLVLTMVVRLQQVAAKHSQGVDPH